MKPTPVVTVMKKMMYPVECCVDLRNEEQNWFRDLSHDPAYAHTVLSTARAYFDFVGSQTFGPRAIMHMNKTMFRLRNKLAETDLVITDSTIFTVLALVLISEALDDHEAAQKHLHGLHELVKLRGGIRGLSQKPLLQIKCCRLVSISQRWCYIPADCNTHATELISVWPSKLDPSLCSSLTIVFRGNHIFLTLKRRLQ